MVKELTRVAEEFMREKGIAREVMNDALKSALEVAVNRRIGREIESEIDVNTSKGLIDIAIPKFVVDEMYEGRELEYITVEDAKEYMENPELDDVVLVPVTLSDLGRRSIYFARQKLNEKLQEAEREIILNEYGNKVGEILIGTVLKSERNITVVNLGRTEGILHFRESIPGETFSRGDLVRAVLLEIRTDRAMPRLVLSRNHPSFLSRLFESEIPEVFDGTVEVRGVARDPGARAKVAVYTMNPNIDPVGACIGVRGSRINAISRELSDERIDVFEWSPDPVQYVTNAISPANVLLTNVFEDEKTLELVVADDQLSLAIGKRGQNVRLAAMITTWRLDILKEKEYSEIRKGRVVEHETELKEFYAIYGLHNLDSLTEEWRITLVSNDIDNLDTLSDISVDELALLLGIDGEKALDIITDTIDYMTSKLDDMELADDADDVDVADDADVAGDADVADADDVDDVADDVDVADDADDVDDADDADDVDVAGDADVADDADDAGDAHA